MNSRMRLIGSLILIMLISGALQAFAQGSQENTLKFGRLLRLVESYYVDTANVSKLTEKAIVNLLSELDPHSVYITKSEVEKMNEPLKGNFEGIGVTFNIFRDTLLVTATVPGGPSEKTGVMAGDRIIYIDGVNVAGIGLTNEIVFDKLRGPKGTKVELKILRRNQKELLDFTIIRDKIPINSLDASYMLDNKTGYIKLNKFSATTMDEFRTAMEKLKKEKMQNLVLDLRNNGGGYLTAAIELAEEFLEANRMIVYTEGINSPKKEYKSTNSGIFETGKLVILVNEGTASASEIVSGAVQDWDRGIIIGRRTYGKGLVQQQYFLTDGSLVRLTTAHYYTPSGRCIQKPYTNGVKEYNTDYQKRLESGEMFSADSITFPDSLKYRTLSKGRTVYGGGGIMPDLFVPLDTSKLYAYYNRLQRNNVIYNYALDYIDNNRDNLSKKYLTFDKFNREFNPGMDMVEELVLMAEKENIPRDQASVDFTASIIRKEIKAIISRDLFGADSFYQVYGHDDKTILKALEVIRDDKAYNRLLENRQISDIQ